MKLSVNEPYYSFGDSESSTNSINRKEKEYKEYQVYREAMKTHFEQTKEVTLVEVIKNLIPNILSSILYFAISLILTFFLSRQRYELLNGVLLGHAIVNILIHILSVGICDAISVIAPKCFGIMNYYKAGQCVNQVRVVILCLYLIIGVVIYKYTDVIVLLIAGVDESLETVGIVCDFVKYFFPIHFVDTQSYILRNYFESQLYYTPVVVSSISSITAFTISSYFFIDLLSLELKGVLISFLIAFIIKFIILLFFLFIFNPLPESNVRPDLNIFEWKSFKITLMIMFFTLISFISEAYGLDLLFVIGSYLAPVDYSRFLLIIELFFLHYSFSLGWSNTLNLMVGSYLGKKSLKNVKLVVKYSLLLGVLLYLPFLSLVFLLKNKILLIFTTNEELYTAEDIQISMVLFGFVMIFAFLSSCLTGVYRGIGQVNVTTIFGFTIYLALMPAACYFFTFKINQGVSGMLFGMILAYMASVICLGIYYFLMIDLHQVIEEYHEENFECQGDQKFKQI